MKIPLKYQVEMLTKSQESRCNECVICRNKHSEAMRQNARQVKDLKDIISKLENEVFDEIDAGMAGMKRKLALKDEQIADKDLIIEALKRDVVTARKAYIHALSLRND